MEAAAAAAAQSSCALPAPLRVGSAQERPSETERLFGHREVPEPAQHGPDLRRGHGPPTRAEEIPDVLAVVVSRSSTVRRRLPLLLPSLPLKHGRCVRCGSALSPHLAVRYELSPPVFFFNPISYLFIYLFLHDLLSDLSPHMKTHFTT